MWKKLRYLWLKYVWNGECPQCRSVELHFNDGWARMECTQCGYHWKIF